MKNLYKISDNDFFEDLNNSISHHKKGCSSFNKFLRNKNITTNVNKSNIYNFPYIHVSVFKRYSKNLISIDENDIVKKLSSSATSGMPSSIYLDKEAIKSQSRLMGEIMRNYLGDKRRPMVVYDLEPKKDSINEIGARYAAIAGYLRFSNNTFFALKKDAGKIVLDDVGLKKFISENENIIHFGFTYIVYEYLLNSNFNSISKSNGDNLLIHIGGWKKLENKKISKQKYEILCKEKISLSKVIDVYGFTELMGINFPDCEEGWKHIPNNVRVIVRDEISRNPIKNQSPGLLQFISPFPKSYCGVSILTDDIGILSDEKCKCGRETNRIKIIGRRKKAEVRGCGDILATKYNSMSSQTIEDSVIIHDFFGTNNLSLNESINRLEPLSQVPAIVLCKLISKASLSWSSDPRLADYKQQGLSFLARWCSEENLIKLLNESLLGNYNFLDSFQHSTINPSTQMRCNPKGIVSHWVAGNVPLLSMLILVQSIITKNKNIVKLSTKTENTLTYLLEPLKEINYEYLGTSYSGNSILKSLLIASFSRNQFKENELISKVADVRIAWGGGNSIEGIKKLKSKINSHNIFFGPKTSFSIISEDYLEFNNNEKRFFLKMARDISSFEQKACSSPHTIFYKGDNIDKFCNNLAKALDVTLDLIPIDKLNGENQNITDAISMGEFTGKVWKNINNDWVIIKNDNFILELPVFSRVIFVKNVNKLDEINSLIYDEVQTVSLGLLGTEKTKTANILSNLGVIRFPDPGLMTNFDNPWDGKLVISELVNFSILGGPFLK